MCTPSPLLPRSICGAGNSILKNEITQRAHNLISVQDQAAMLSRCSCTRMQRMPKGEKGVPSVVPRHKKGWVLLFPESVKWDKYSWIQNSVVEAVLHALGDHIYISVLLWYLSPYKDYIGSLNEKSTISAQISTHSTVSSMPSHAPRLSSRGLGSTPATTFLTADLENDTEPGTHWRVNVSAMPCESLCLIETV